VSSRTRTVNWNHADGTPCAHISEEKDCCTYITDDGHECPPCPYDFTPWSQCTKSCCGHDEWTFTDGSAHGEDTTNNHTCNNPGVQTRDQLLTGVGYVSQLCVDNDQESRVCNTHMCSTSAPTPHPTPPTSAPTKAPTPCPLTPPTCNVLDGDYLVLQATHDYAYVDAGATCSDQQDGDISTSITTETDSIDLGNLDGLRTKTYEVVYTCRNSCEVEAIGCTRTVVVVDSTCPACQMETGPALIEASFPYDDAGVTCTDDLDGALANVSMSYGATGAVNVESTGTYLITYIAEDRAGNRNDGSNTLGCLKSSPVVRQVVVIDTLKPAIALRYNNQTIHVGGTPDISQSDLPHTNPVKDLAPDAIYFGPPHVPEGSRRLMAESRTTSGHYAFAAAASGIVGLALTVLAARRSREQAIHPPV